MTQPRQAILIEANKPVLRVYTPLADEIGLSPSILLLQLDFWLNSDSAVFEDGHWWIKLSIRDMYKRGLSFWSLDTINRNIIKLQEKELIVAETPEDNEQPRRIRLNAEGVSKLESIALGGVRKSDRVSENRTEGVRKSDTYRDSLETLSLSAGANTLESSDFQTVIKQYESLFGANYNHTTADHLLKMLNDYGLKAVVHMLEAMFKAGKRDLRYGWGILKNLDLQGELPSENPTNVTPITDKPPHRHDESCFECNPIGPNPGAIGNGFFLVDGKKVHCPYCWQGIYERPYVEQAKLADWMQAQIRKNQPKKQA